ncbi:MULTISPECIES: DUF922 domain-containing protein [unclassified Agarivorans]|uniref:DUF922 domain-containing protein n=1 Tax=unclassified Agarivorans TaxID=2636026 RepID=UPI003D7E6844
MRRAKWNGRVILLVFILFSPVVHAASVQSEIEYYDVNAGDLKQLRAQLMSEGPLKRGHHYSISGQYLFNWTPKVARRNARCESLSPELLLRAELIMPRWISQSKADFATQQSWISYIAAAQQYHQKIAWLIEQSAERFVQQTKGLSAAGCQQLEALINAKGRAALANARQKIRTYQRQTAYGESLGLTIP